MGKYLFLHLKTLKKSTASESIIESTETAWRQFQYFWANRFFSLIANVRNQYSPRSATRSKAFSNGVSIQTILLKGYWATDSVLARFYNREIKNPGIEESSLRKILPYNRRYNFQKCYNVRSMLRKHVLYSMLVWAISCHVPVEKCLSNLTGLANHNFFLLLRSKPINFGQRQTITSPSTQFIIAEITF